jgi:TolA-binding protein
MAKKNISPTQARNLRMGREKLARKMMGPRMSILKNEVANLRMRNQQISNQQSTPIIRPQIKVSPMKVKISLFEQFLKTDFIISGKQETNLYSAINYLIGEINRLNNIINNMQHTNSKNIQTRKKKFDELETKIKDLEEKLKENEND